MKHYFPIPFVLALVVTFGYSFYKMFFIEFSFAWIGLAIAVMPMLGFFTYVALANVPRTNRRLPLHLGASAIGVLLTLLEPNFTVTALAFVVGLLGSCLYLFWYTPLDRRQSNIVVGEKIPHFSINDIDGHSVDSLLENGRKKIWMFVRGNWCPLCVAQVQELADSYKELHDLGADVFLISSQSEKESKKLAHKFNVSIRFLVDEKNKVATLLGVDHVGGVPFGLPGYDIDTAMPTVIITDASNTVVFADQTDDYRVRPEPELFLRVLEGL